MLFNGTHFEYDYKAEKVILSNHEVKKIENTTNQKWNN